MSMLRHGSKAREKSAQKYFIFCNISISFDINLYIRCVMTPASRAQSANWWGDAGLPASIL